MSWTAPRTYVTNEVVTSSILNTDHRDNLSAILHPYNYAPSDVDVVSTITETSVYSKVITGGDLGSNGLAKLMLICDALYNNSTANTLTLRFKFGGSSVLAGVQSGTLSASRRVIHIELCVANRGATNSQLVWASGFAALGSPLVGIGNSQLLQDQSYFPLGLQNTVAVDTTADQTLEVTAEWSASSANNSFRKRLGILHLGQN